MPRDVKDILREKFECVDKLNELESRISKLQPEAYHSSTPDDHEIVSPDELQIGDVIVASTYRVINRIERVSIRRRGEYYVAFTRGDPRWYSAGAKISRVKDLKIETERPKGA